MAEYSRFLIFLALGNQASPGTENRSVGGSIPPLGTILTPGRVIAVRGLHALTVDHERIRKVDLQDDASGLERRRNVASTICKSGQTCQAGLWARG